MEWPPYSTDLNPTGNLWSVLKSKYFLNGMQFGSKNYLWQAIQETSASLTGKGIPSSTLSMDRRLVKVTKEDWGHFWKENQEFRRKILQRVS